MKNTIRSASMLLLCMNLPLLGSAQQVSDSVEDDVVVLNPFTISSDSIKGYATTSSLGASRIAVPITELASSTITINENLISDTVAQDLRDTFNMVAGVTHGNAGTGNQISQLPSIRGYNLSEAQRDGLPSLMFTESGGFDYSLAERMEIVKGPAGVLYGSHSPGGVVNITSKTPLAQPKTMVEGRIGSFSRYRGSVDTSGLSQDGKLGYRFAGTYWDWDGPTSRPNEPGATTIINPSLSYELAEGLKIWAWYAHVDDQASNRRTANTYGFGMRTPEHLGRPVPHERILNQSNLWHNLSGVEIDSIEIGLEKVFSSTVFDGAFRLVARSEERDSDGSRIRGTGGRNYLAANDVLIGTESRDLTYAQVDDELVRITRNASRFDDRGNVTERDFIGADFTLNFDTGPVSQSLLTYVQYFDQTDVGRSRTIDISFPTLPAEVLAANGWDNGRIEVWPNATYAPIDLAFMQEYGGASIDRGSTTASDEQFAWGIMDRVSILDDRLIAIAGLRYDSVDGFSEFRVENNPNVTTSPLTDSEWSSKYGLVGKIYEGEHGEVSLFYNNAETFTIETRVDTRIATQGQSLPNRITTTNEFGLKTSLFGSRVVATIAVFDNEESNFLLSQRDDLAGTITGIPAPPGSILGEPYLAPAGTRSTEGWDIDLALNPVDGLDVILGYGEVDAAVTDGAIITIPEFTLGALLRYEVQNGPLEGFSAAWQFSQWGESEMDPGFSEPATDRTYLAGDSVHNLILGYRYNEHWNFRLKVANALDEYVVYPSQFWTAIGIAAERNYTFSASYTF